jgi:hypothetical protein
MSTEAVIEGTIDIEGIDPAHDKAVHDAADAEWRHVGDRRGMFDGVLSWSLECSGRDRAKIVLTTESEDHTSGLAGALARVVAKVHAAGHTVTDVEVFATSTNEDDWSDFDGEEDLDEQTPEPMIFRLDGNDIVTTVGDIEVGRQTVTVAAS